MNVNTVTSVWKNNNFLILIFSQTLSRIGSPATSLAAQFLAVTLYGANPFDLSMLSACSILPYALFSIPAGIWSDRWSKRNVIMVCDLVRGIILVLFCFAIYCRLDGFYVLLLAMLCLRSLDVWFDVAFSSVVPEIVGRSGIASGNSGINLTGQLGLMIGTSFGSSLLGAFGPMVALGLDATTFIISGMLAPFIKLPDRIFHTGKARIPFRTDLSSGFRVLLADRRLQVLVSISMIFSFILFAFSAIQFFFLYREINLTVVQIGFVFTIATGASALGALLAPWLASRYRLSVFLSSAVGLRLLGFGLLLSADGLWAFPVVCVSEFLSGGAISIYNIVVVSYRQRITVQENQGRLVGAIRFISWGTAPAGALLGGVLSEHFGVRELIIDLMISLGIFLCILRTGPISKILSEMVVE